MAYKKANIHLETVFGATWQGTGGNQILPRTSMSTEDALSADEKCGPGQIP